MIISSKLNSELKEKYIKLDNYLKEFYSIYDLPGFAIGVIKNNILQPLEMKRSLNNNSKTINTGLITVANIKYL